MTQTVIKYVTIDGQNNFCSQVFGVFFWSLGPKKQVFEESSLDFVTEL